MSVRQDKPRILIVDDTPENLHLLLSALSGSHAVIAAKSGEKALQLVRESLPDLILLDVMMPGLDGFSVCRILKEDAATRHIPIIFLTALVGEADEVRALELGAVDYIRKPFRLPVVQARVRTHIELLLSRRRLAEQNRELLLAAALREEVDRITRHDLKSPLNAIIGVPQLLLEEDNLSADQRTLLKEVEGAGYRMLEMINHSLDLYRMEVGSYACNPRPLDVHHLLGRVIREQESLMRSLGVRIGQRLLDGAAEGPQMAIGEEMLCFTIFANLIKNALEASPPGGEVTVASGRVGDRLVVTVHNQGMVPESVRERFFDKFVTAGKKGGTGLGTYSALLMARVQGADIQMETSAQEGTRLTVRLVAMEVT